MRKNDILDGKKRDSAHNGVEIAAKATEKTREGQEWWEGDPVMANIHAGPEYIKLELKGKVDFAVREAFFLIVFAPFLGRIYIIKSMVFGDFTGILRGF